MVVGVLQHRLWKSGKWMPCAQTFKLAKNGKFTLRKLLTKYGFSQNHLRDTFQAEIWIFYIFLCLDLNGSRKSRKHCCSDLQIGQKTENSLYVNS